MVLVLILSVILIYNYLPINQKTKNLMEEIGCNDFYCFEKHYQDLVIKKDITTAFDDLKTRYADPKSPVKSFCHLLTHVIGRAAVQKYPDLIEAFKQGDHFCWSGYYHGVMEANLYKAKKEELPEVINQICQNLPGRKNYSFDYYNCVHGLGHGVMYVSQNELFEALKLCDHLDGSWERESCYGGVFMENVIADFENHFTEYLKPEEPMYPCPEVSEKNKQACYLMQTSYVLKINGYDFSNAFEECRKVEDGYRNICFQSLGRDASGHTISNIEKTKNVCLLGKDLNEKLNCAVGAAKDFISYFHSDRQAREFCAVFDLKIRDTCLDAVEDYYKSF